MGTYSKPLDLYNAQMKRLQEGRLTMRQGHAILAQGGLDDAQALTGGGLSPKQTRGAFARGQSPSLSNPTARRRILSPRQIANRGIGKTGVPLLPINIQSRRLHDSFRLVKARSMSASQIFDLTQINPGGGAYRLLPGGTKKMVDSGYEAEIKKRWKTRNAAFLDHWRSLLKRS